MVVLRRGKRCAAEETTMDQASGRAKPKDHWSSGNCILHRDGFFICAGVDVAERRSRFAIR
jgi:hypothetical protein